MISYVNLVESQNQSLLQFLLQQDEALKYLHPTIVDFRKFIVAYCRKNNRTNHKTYLKENKTQSFCLISRKAVELLIKQTHNKQLTSIQTIRS